MPDFNSEEKLNRDSGDSGEDVRGEKPSVTTRELQTEIDRVAYQRKVRDTLRSTIFILITAAAAAVLIATLVLPIFRIVGTSMSPTLDEGNIVLALKDKNVQQGDLVAFYYNNRVLVKRVIAKPGEWVSIDAAGNVYVNDRLLDEPYLKEKSLGSCDVEFPYQVPDGTVFVMGDHRDVSIDSRTKAMGCISKDEMIGKLWIRIWPLNQFGAVK
ncbi:MAG: signal peptidase I [Lachnospiraceae bacterium]|jgi:signal peptidase I|nr:signal peptidase I [Lachnospiraceae bacterium]MCI1328692.1 signal peptidase I [Lachnospiraceae bacterium]